MRIEYEKLFPTPDELVDFLCKSNEEQDRIVAELFAANKEAKVELSCKFSVKGIGD